MFSEDGAWLVKKTQCNILLLEIDCISVITYPLGRLNVSACTEILDSFVCTLKESEKEPDSMSE